MTFYKNINIYLNQIEFGPINDDVPHITLKLVILYENITICLIRIEMVQL